MSTPAKHTPGPWKAGTCTSVDADTLSGTAELVTIDAGDDEALAIFAQDADPMDTDLSLILAAPDLLAELRAANQIIKNALNLMDSRQKAAWGEANERDAVAGEGITRRNERDAAIAKATGGAQ